MRAVKRAFHKPYTIIIPVLILALVFFATSWGNIFVEASTTSDITSNDAPTDKFKANDTDELVMDLTIPDAWNGASSTADILQKDGSGDAWQGDTLNSIPALGTTTGVGYKDDGTGGFQGTEAVVRDTDADSVFSSQGDTDLDGTAPSAGTSITGTEPTGWNFFYNDATDTDAYDTASDWIGLDDDGDGVYTSAADTEVDCDGSSTNNKGSCDAHSAGDALVATAAGDNLCTDSLTSPTVVYIDGDGDCTSGSGGTDTTLLDDGSGIGTATTSVGTNWAYDDADSGGTYTDGEDLYIENVSGELTFSAAADTTVDGSAPTKGTAITGTKDADWTTLKFNDATSDGGAYASGSDWVGLDDGGSGTYTDVADTDVYSTGGLSNGDTLTDFASDCDSGGSGTQACKYTGSSPIDSSEDIYIDEGDQAGAAPNDTVDRQDDQLTGIGVQNTGTAVNSTDIAAVEVWAEQGSTAGFQSGEDTNLGTMTVHASDDQEWRLSGLSQSVSAGGQRVYVTVDIAGSPTDTRTLNFSLPIYNDVSTNGTATEAGDVGLFMASDNDGPTDNDVTNSFTQTIDTTAPSFSSATTLDNNNDGTVDFVKVTYSENIDDSSIDTDVNDETSDFEAGIADTTSGNLTESFSSGTPSSGNETDAANDNVIYIGVSSNNEIISADKTDYTLNIEQVGAVADTAGNELASFASQTSSDGAKPLITSRTYQDNGSDGSVDRLALDFTESVTWNGSDTNQFSITENDLTGFSVVSGVSGSGTSTLTLTVGATTDLTGVSGGTEPTVQYTQSGTAGNRVVDGNTNYLDSEGSATSISDGASPVISDFAYQDNDGNGQIDQFNATFTETVTSSSTLAPNDLNLTNVGDFTNAAFGGSTTDTITGSTSSAVVPLGTESSVQDTNDGSGSLAISTQNSFSLTDGTNTNSASAAQTQASFTDSAAPVITTFTYQDNDANGQIDQFDVAFSETVASASNLEPNDLNLTNVGDFTNAAFGSGTTDTITGSVTSATVALGTESSAQDTNDGSGSLAISTQNSFSLTDGTNTNSASAAQTQASFADGAAPVISDFAYQDNDGNGQIDQFNVSFTETVTSASNLEPNDMNLTNVGDFTSAAFGSGTTDTITSSVSSAVVALGTESSVQDTNDGSGSLAVSTQNSFSLTDGTNTNSASAAQTQASFTDSAAPVTTTFTYQDNDADGKIDQFDVAFSETVTAASVLRPTDLNLTNVGDFTSAAFDSGTTDSITGSTTSAVVALGTESTVEDTREDSGSIAVSSQNGFSLTDGTNTNSASAAQSQASFADGAAPRILTTTVTYQDQDQNGTVDNLRVTWTENIDAVGSFNAGDHVIADGSQLTFGAPSGTDDPAAASNILNVSATGASNVTGDSSAPTYTYTNNGGYIEDADGNVAATQDTMTMEDGASPVILSGAYQDNNTDGEVDRVAFTTTADTGVTCTAFTGSTDFTVGTAGSVNLTDSAGDTCSSDGTSTVTITLATTGATDTTGGSTEPVVTYTQPGNGVEDGSGNDVPTKSSLTLEDGAAPLVTTVSPANGASDVAENADIEATFTESMTTAGFTVTLSPTAGTITNSWANSDTELTASHSETFSSGTDYTVSLSGTDASGQTNSLSGGIEPLSWSFGTLEGHSSQFNQKFAEEDSSSDTTDDSTTDDTSGEDTTDDQTTDDTTDETTTDENTTQELLDSFTQNDPEPADALPAEVGPGMLVKSPQDSTVYFIDSDNRRHAFPHESVYFSWYNSFGSINTIAADVIADIPVGSNVTVRPGTYLIKLQTDPRVYAVEPYGTIRWLSTEEAANTLYGENWKDRIIDVSDSFFTNYSVGEQLDGTAHPDGSLLQFGEEPEIYYANEEKTYQVTEDTFNQAGFNEQFVIQLPAGEFMYADGGEFPGLNKETLMTLN